MADDNAKGGYVPQQDTELTESERSARILVEALRAEASKIKKFEPVTGDFNDSKTGASVSKYEGLVFKDGNFQMPEPILEAAKLRASELIDSAKLSHINLYTDPQFADASKLTKDGKITLESLSAYLLAKSMGANTESYIDSRVTANPKDSIRATFDNQMTESDHNADPKLVFEMARQIMGDNGMSGVIGLATNTPAADAQFTNQNKTRTGENTFHAK